MLTRPNWHRWQHRHYGDASKEQAHDLCVGKGIDETVHHAQSRAHHGHERNLFRDLVACDVHSRCCHWPVLQDRKTGQRTR